MNKKKNFNYCWTIRTKHKKLSFVEVVLDEEKQNKKKQSQLFAIAQLIS